MLILDAVVAGLAWLGRQGTRALAASVFIGIALPPLAELLRHVFLEALLVLLLMAFLRVDPQALRSQFRRPGLVIAASLWTMLAVPLALCGLALVFDLPQWSQALYLALLLQAVAPPVTGSPALAAILGLDAALSLAVLIVATAATPVTVPVFVALFAGAALDVSPLALVLKLAGMLGGTALAAALIRRFVGQPFLHRHAQPIDGISVIALFTFSIGVMGGVGPYILAQPLLVASLIACAFALSLALIATTYLIMQRAGRSQAMALGLAVGSRNMGLMVAAAGSAAPELTWLYFAIAQFPIYTLPHLMQPLIRGIIKGEASRLPLPEHGVRRPADD